MAMTLVSTVTVGSGGAANIEWTNIPQTGKDLLVVLSGRSEGTNYAVNVTLNGSTSNYSYRALEGDGSFAQSFTAAGPGAPPRFFASNTGSGATASTFSNASTYISNYTLSVAKSISVDTVTENNGTTAFQDLIAALWNDTSAITSIKLEPPSVDFAEHTVASLYIIS